MQERCSVDRLPGGKDLRRLLGAQAVGCVDLRDGEMLQPARQVSRLLTTPFGQG